MRAMKQAPAAVRPLCRHETMARPRRGGWRAAIATAIVALVGATATSAGAQNVIVDETVLDSLGPGPSGSGLDVPAGNYPTIDIYNYQATQPGIGATYRYYPAGTVYQYAQPAVTYGDVYNPLGNQPPRLLRYPPASFPVSTLLVPPATAGAIPTAVYVPLDNPGTPTVPPTPTIVASSGSDAIADLNLPTVPPPTPTPPSNTMLATGSVTPAGPATTAALTEPVAASIVTPPPAESATADIAVAEAAAADQAAVDAAAAEQAAAEAALAAQMEADAVAQQAAAEAAAIEAAEVAAAEQAAADQVAADAAAQAAAEQAAADQAAADAAAEQAAIEQAAVEQAEAEAAAQAAAEQATAEQAAAEAAVEQAAAEAAAAEQAAAEAAAAEATAAAESAAEAAAEQAAAEQAAAEAAAAEQAAAEAAAAEATAAAESAAEAAAEQAAAEQAAADALAAEEAAAAEAAAAEAAAVEAAAAEAALAAETAAAGEAADAETLLATLPPAEIVEGQVRIVFAPESAEVPPEAEAALKELAAMMAADETLRLELLAYAAGNEDQANRARRMSLSRALAVRAYLINEGVRSTRMDVRALGNNVDGEPADRVDILPKAL